MDSIKSRARNAKEALKGILEAAWDPPATLKQDIQEMDGNFTLWAVNLGVFDSGHSSLDYRLQEVPEAADLIKNLLDDLTDHAQGLSMLAMGADPEDYGEIFILEDRSACESDIGSDGDDEFGEVDARALSIKDVVLRLFRLARSIRNYSTRSAQGRRNIYNTYPSQDRSKIVENLLQIEKHRVIDYIHDLRRDYNGLDDESLDSLLIDEMLLKTDLSSGSAAKMKGKSKDQPRFADQLHLSHQQGLHQLLGPSTGLSEEDELLVDRLAKANSRRRQQFIYWRYRQEASIMATEVSREDSVGPGLGEDSLVPRENSAVQPKVLGRAVSMPSSATKLKREQINIAERVSVASGASRPPSARGPHGSPAEWPSAPAEIPEGPYFTCPYCYNLCPERYRSKEGWKSHLMHDLKPYCCTYTDCETGDQLYDSWADWTSHEMLVHNKVWTCLEHPDEEYRSVEEYRLHVKHAHPEDADAMQTPQIISARATGSRSSGRACPFCLVGYNIAGDLHRHIAWHLETVALGALPRSTGLEIGSQEGGERDSAAQDQGDADSRAGHFDDLPLPGPSDEFNLLEEEPATSTGNSRIWTSAHDAPGAQPAEWVDAKVVGGGSTQQTVWNSDDRHKNGRMLGCFVDKAGASQPACNQAKHYWKQARSLCRSSHLYEHAHRGDITYQQLHDLQAMANRMGRQRQSQEESWKNLFVCLYPQYSDLRSRLNPYVGQPLLDRQEKSDVADEDRRRGDDGHQQHQNSRFGGLSYAEVVGQGQSQAETTNQPNAPIHAQGQLLSPFLLTPRPSISLDRSPYPPDLPWRNRRGTHASSDLDDNSLDVAAPTSEGRTRNDSPVEMDSTDFWADVDVFDMLNENDVTRHSYEASQ